MIDVVARAHGAVRRAQRVGVAFALLAAGVADAAVAEAANELCGQTITQSITLTANQTCTGDGLIVVGDNITIDLGGFTLSGDGDMGDVGIVLQGPPHVTIQNGTIRGFDIGVGFAVAGSAVVKLSHVTLRGNVHFGAAPAAVTFIVDKCSALENGVGILAEAVQVLKITSTAFVANTTHGLQFDARSATITNVVATGNGERGLFISESGEKITVQSSLFAHNGAEGVFIADEFSTPGKITLTKNTIVGNGAEGVVVDGSGDSAHHVAVAVIGNVIEGNGAAAVTVTNDADDTVVTGNRLIGNAGDGVTIDATSDATIVRGNTIIGNGRYGIVTTNPTATLAKNVVNANHDLAITAPSGAVDGGGNTTRANGVAGCSPAIACPPEFTPKPGPVTPTCGMHVATSITLGASTPLCAGTDGLIVDADGVTINLNGHAVRGDGNSVTTGVVIPAGRKHVTIANGLVQGFQIGIGTDLASDGLKITNVEVSGNNLHGAVLAGAGPVISKSAFVNNWGSGLVLDDFATAPKVSASFFVGNGVDGIVLRAPGGVLTNLVSALNLQAGVHLLSNGDGKLQRGIVAANGKDGVRIEGAFGVNAPSAVKKSVIVGNGMDGIVVAANAVGMLFDGNVSAANGGHGVALMSAPDQTTLKKNALVGNVRDGLFVDVAVQTTAVTQTSALGNGGSGLNVDNVLSTLTKNLAVGNFLSGIRTPSGATDGGGNKAHDNIAPQQCTPPIACP